MIFNQFLVHVLFWIFVIHCPLQNTDGKISWDFRLWSNTLNMWHLCSCIAFWFCGGGGSGSQCTQYTWDTWAAFWDISHLLPNILTVRCPPKSFPRNQRSFLIPQGNGCTGILAGRIQGHCARGGMCPSCQSYPLLLPQVLTLLPLYHLSNYMFIPVLFPETPMYILTSNCLHVSLFLTHSVCVNLYRFFLTLSFLLPLIFCFLFSCILFLKKMTSKHRDLGRFL